MRSLLLIALVAYIFLLWIPAILVGAIVGKKYYGSTFRGICIGFLRGWTGAIVLYYMSLRKEL